MVIDDEGWENSHEAIEDDEERDQMRLGELRVSAADDQAEDDVAGEAHHEQVSTTGTDALRSAGQAVDKGMQTKGEESGQWRFPGLPRGTATLVTSRVPPLLLSWV